MNSVQKFLFETSFDGVEDETAPPDAPPHTNPQSFGESELERARDEGFAAGREQGLMEAAGSIENASARTLEAIAGEIRALLPALAQDAERRNGEALKAAVTIVRKLFPRTAEAHGTAEIEALVAQCLGQLRDEPRVVVRVCDQLLDPLNERLGGLAADCGYEGKIVLLAEEALLPGDAKVEWADGGAERDSARLWRKVDEIIARATAFGATDAQSDTTDAPIAEPIGPGDDAIETMQPA